MLKTKSIFALLLALIMVVSLAACGGGTTNAPAADNKAADSAPAEEAKTETKAADSAPASGGATTITFIGWEASPAETESVKKGIALFESRNADIKVEYTPTPGDYEPKLLTLVAGDAAPDVFFLGAGGYRNFVNKGILLDVTSQFDAEFTRTDFIQSAMNIMDVEGKIYGLSSCTVSPVLYYNKDLFDAASLEYPPSDPAKAWDWETFRDVSKKLTVKDGDKTTQYGSYGAETRFVGVEVFLMENGLKIFNPDYQSADIAGPAAVEVIEKIKALRAEDGSAPDAVTLENMGMSAAQMLQTGKVAMVIDGSWALQELARMKFPIGVGVLPKFAQTKTQGQAHVHSISAKTKNPEAAWKFLSFLSGEEYQLDLIRDGLWMPNRASLYTQEGIKKWLNADVHPEGFEQLAAYFESADVEPGALNPRPKAMTIFDEGLDAIFKEGKDIATTLDETQARMTEELTRAE